MMIFNNDEIGANYFQNASGYATQLIGTIQAFYYLGLFSGYFICHRLIRRVGHIRAISVFSAVAAAVALSHWMFMSPFVWVLLRFLAGICVFGFFIVIESWLGECTTVKVRGRVFSIYMVSIYLGNGSGQQLLNFGNGRDDFLFALAAMMFSLSLIPVGVTKSAHPKLPEPGRHTFKTLCRKVPVGMMGCLAAGLISSAFYAMGPVFGADVGLSVFQLSWFMSAAIFGGLSVQWGVGVISDGFDRTMVLIIIFGFIALFSTVIFSTAGISHQILIVEIAFFGGAIFSTYPVTVSCALDRFEPGDATVVSSGLILYYSIGAVLGPILSAAAMSFLQSPYGLFAYFIIISAVFTICGFILRHRQQIDLTPVNQSTG